MSWKEPDLYSLKANSRIKEILHDSYYFGEFGEIRDAPLSEQILVLANYLLPYAFLYFVGSVFASFYGIDQPWRFLYFLVLAGILVYSLYMFYYNGFKKFNEYWIKFDDKEELLSIVTREGDQWEVVDIPYEEVEDIRYSGGTNGRIILVAPHVEIKTYRISKKNPLSTTEIWDRFAKIGAPMSDWPYTLRCPSCERTFGHFQGTALCPFDEKVILVDDSIKGRIDPESATRSDLERV